MVKDLAGADITSFTPSTPRFDTQLHTCNTCTLPITNVSPSNPGVERKSGESEVGDVHPRQVLHPVAHVSAERKTFVNKRVSRARFGATSTSSTTFG